GRVRGSGRVGERSDRALRASDLRPPAQRPRDARRGRFVARAADTPVGFGTGRIAEGRRDLRLRQHRRSTALRRRRFRRALDQGARYRKPDRLGRTARPSTQSGGLAPARCRLAARPRAPFLQRANVGEVDTMRRSAFIAAAGFVVALGGAKAHGDDQSKGQQQQAQPQPKKAYDDAQGAFDDAKKKLDAAAKADEDLQKQRQNLTSAEQKAQKTRQEAKQAQQQAVQKANQAEQTATDVQQQS